MTAESGTGRAPMTDQTASAEVIKPKVTIVIGREEPTVGTHAYNTLRINNKVTYLSSNAPKTPKQVYYDAMTILKHLHKNQGRLVKHSEILQLFKDTNNEKSDSYYDYYNSRIDFARTRLINRLKVGNKTIIKTQQSKHGVELGIMDYDVELDIVEPTVEEGSTVFKAGNN
jgi:hypothetical protein